MAAKTKREKRAFANGDAIIIQKGKILLEKRHSGKWGGYWCLPGGKLRQGESVSAGVAREVFEETGFRVRIGKLAGIYSGKKKFRGSTSIDTTFFSEITGGKERLQKEEVDELGWFGPENLPEKLAFDHDKRIKDAFAIIGGRKRAPVIS
ncbi:MAG: NUDIX hydrolase [archaeon]